MAGRDNFRPNYNYTFSSFDIMNTANLGGQIEDDQPVFPIDYRHYFGNPVFPSSVPSPQSNIAFNRLQSNFAGINYSVQSFPDQVNISTEDSRGNVRKSRAYLPDDEPRNLSTQCDELSRSKHYNDTAKVSIFERRNESIIGTETGTTKTDESSIAESSNVNIETVEENETFKDVESDVNEFEGENVVVHGAESNNKVMDKPEDEGETDSNSKKNSDAEEENDDDEENTSNVSDASTIVEDEEEISSKLNHKGKTPKVKLLMNNNSKKKRRKQTLPKPMTPADKKDFTCETCGRVVQSKRALIQHRNLHTDKYKCEECQKIFNSEVSLKNHHKVHKGYIGNEVCNVCDKTFYDKSSLNKHTLSVHMGIKNFQCEYCSLSFFARKTYEEHVRVHTGERPFKCTHCPKAYKRISDLNHHLRLHRGEVSHTCEKCGDGFRRVSELNRHMMKHSGDVGHIPVHTHKSCTWCGLAFPTIRALNKHFNAHMESLAPPQTVSPNHKVLEKEKLKLVNDIVHDLGTNLIGPDVSKTSSKETLLLEPTWNANFPDSGDNTMVLPQQGLDMTYRGMAAEQIQHAECKENELSTVNYPASTFLRTDFNIASNFLRVNSTETASMLMKVEDPNQTHDAIADTAESNEIANAPIGQSSPDSNEKNDEFKECMENGGSIKTEIEIDTDYIEEHDDYDGDTDVEDFDYIMNSSPLEEEESLKNTDEVNVKIKIEPIYNDSEDENEGVNSDLKDDETKDPDFLPPVVRARKRKAAVPRRKRVRVNQLKTELEDSSENMDAAEEASTKKKKVKSKPIIDDSSMDLEALKCLQCGKSFSKKVSLVKHMHLHRGTFSCEICGKFFSTKRSLETHIDNHEGRKTNTAVCKVCDKAFYDSSSLNKHVKTVHMDYKPFPCTVCDRRFSENKTLVEHMRVHTGERPFACEVCGKTYKRVSELNFHIRKHKGEINLSCQECGKGFMRMGQLRQHMQMRHNKERPFRCFLCAKTFPTHPMLKDHQKIHVNQRKFSCEKCGYKFHTKSKLEKHLRRKTDCQEHTYRNANGMFECKFCHGEFNSVSERKAHIEEVHPEDAGFPCGVCGKLFSRSQALKIHLKIHYQVRDFKCTMCSAAFIQRHHLTQHIATHTGSRPYQCQICLKNFAHNATLYNHLKHHVNI